MKKINIEAVLLTIALICLIAAASKAQLTTGFKMQLAAPVLEDTGRIDTVQTIIAITRKKSTIIQPVPGYKVMNCQKQKVYALLTIRRKPFPGYIKIWGWN